MEWILPLVIIFTSLCLLMITRLPVAFCFLCLNLIGMYFLFGGVKGLYQYVLTISTSLSFFSFVTVPLFIIMGEALFHCGIIYKAIDNIDNWTGRMPGRLAVVTIIAAVMFSAMSGSSLGTVAMLGATMVPEMEKRGYKKPISLGAAMGGGGLDAIIPPSGLAVVIGALGEISIGKLLIAGFLPGLLMACLYMTYIVGRCIIQPSLAPRDVPKSLPLRQKLLDTIRYIFPFLLIIVFVLGTIFLGIATPTESAAMGALSAFILAAFYGKLTWENVKGTFKETLSITSMLLLIIAGATAFSQIIAMTGASRGFGEWVLSLNMDPIWIVVSMQIIILMLGCFMDPMAILMITFPIFLPVIRPSGFDMVLFGLLTLINANLGGRTPPFGMILFVMKGVAPLDTSMAAIYRASLPFVICDIISMAIFIAFPPIVTFLPSFMKY